MLENNLKIQLQVYTLKIKELKELLKKPEIAPVEKTAIEYSIREKETEFEETRKIHLKETTDKIGREQETIKSAENSKKKLFERVRKTLKKSRMDKKRLEQQAKKQTRSLRKISANQNEIVNEIQNNEVKDMVSRRIGLIEHDLSKLRKELEAKEREKKEKMRKQEDKRVAKTLKEREKKEEKERRQLQKTSTRKNRK
jgi:hypothetical protein